MQKIVMVTGATSGFGWAIAKKFSAEGFRVVVTGRREERLQALVAEMGEGALPLVFDVSDRQAVTEAIGSLPEDWRAIDILVNNAGLALGRDYFEEAEIDDWETMMDTNYKGLVYVTRAVLPAMIERRTGHIINIGSIAGKEVYDRGNGYCASKFAVDAITKAMRIDLLRHHIRVTGIHPGAAETEFSLVRFKGDERLARAVYQGFEPLTGEDVADVVYYTTTVPAHVCINDLVLMPVSQATATYFHRT